MMNGTVSVLEADVVLAKLYIIFKGYFFYNLKKKFFVNDDLGTGGYKL